MNKVLRNQRQFTKKGSILIWSVMLGFVLTSVFFFFGMRQRANIMVQRDTVEILNTRSYLKSYADYLQKNANDLGELNSEFDGIQVSLTRQVDEIFGSVDVNDNVQYDFSGSVIIEWNKCSDDFRADLVLNDVIYNHDGDSECTNGEEGYDDATSSIVVSSPFIIGTANTPFRYRITGTGLIDSQWHLEISTALDYGKKIRVKRTFN